MLRALLQSEGLKGRQYSRGVGSNTIGECLVARNPRSCSLELGAVVEDDEKLAAVARSSHPGSTPGGFPTIIDSALGIYVEFEHETDRRNDMSHGAT